MTKLIILLFMVILSPLALAQTTSAPQITANIVENAVIAPCTQAVCSCSKVFSSFTYNLAWTRTPAPAGYKWAPVMMGGRSGSRGFVISNGSANSGSTAIYKNPNAYASSPCNRWIRHTEQKINAGQWSVWGYLIAPNGTKTLVKSGIAQLSNPSTLN